MGIDWFGNEMIRKNNTLHWLLTKAAVLPECRKNILITKILCWDKHITLLAYDIISNRECSIYNVDFRCREFIEERKLANKNFIKFFFELHSGIAKFYTTKIEKVLISNLSSKVKITALFNLFCELMNITRIELENLDINCEIIGNNHICDDYMCKQQPNIVTLMITPDHISDNKILDNVVECFKTIDKNKTGKDNKNAVGAMNKSIAKYVINELIIITIIKTRAI